MTDLLARFLTLLPVWASTGIIAGLGAWFGSYLKKKGENYASKEDFTALLDQLKQTTEATKAIEQRIEHQFSHKTRVWEMKQEAFYEVLQTLNDMDEILLTFSSIVTNQKNKTFLPDVVTEAKLDVATDWKNANRAYSAARTKALVVCSGKATEAMRTAQTELQAIYMELKKGNDTYLDVGVHKSMMQAFARVIKSIRDELDVHEHAVYSNSL